ncbi:MAG: recombinase family protein [Candidatus Pacebacteria bacterium]|nr:recombinase family protein [Candidatus Paceibacterota bacterium]
MNTAVFEKKGVLGRQPEAKEAVKVRYCLYARKSTEQDEQQALSIDSQIKEMTALAAREGLDVVEVKRESHSAKEAGQREIFNEMLDGIHAGKYNSILTWAADRISRNAGDLGKVVDLMDAGALAHIQTYSQKFSNNPNEKFLLMILCSQAKLENDNKSINVKRGLKTRAEMGMLPGVAPLGYLNDRRSDHKCEYLIDSIRAPIVRMIFEKVASERWSGPKIYLWLKNDLDFKTKNNKHVTISSIYELLKNPFYCGVFEYPRQSGNWYVGKHEALITKELFETVRQKVVEETKPRKSGREFAFVRMMTCGYCESGVTAMEVDKLIKSEGIKRTYTYYVCSRAKDRACKNPYIREDNLMMQLGEIIDKIEIDKIGAKHLIEKEVARFNKLNANVIGGKDKAKVKEMDIKRYAKYLLEEGSVEEKRELLEHLRGKLIMNDKKIELVI